MADPDDIFYVNMFYNEKIYTPELRLDHDGFYRWRCTLGPYHDRKMYMLLLKIWAVISVGGAVAGLLLAQVPADAIRKDPEGYQRMLLERRILYALLGYAALFLIGLLIGGLIRLIESGPSTYWYRMNEEFIQIRPSGRGSGINLFREVKRVELRPQAGEILLISRWGKCPILIRREDYEQVKKHILSLIPETAQVSETVGS